jgi:hypothetical protein
VSHPLSLLFCSPLTPFNRSSPLTPTPYHQTAYAELNDIGPKRGSNSRLKRSIAPYPNVQARAHLRLRRQSRAPSPSPGPSAPRNGESEPDRHVGSQPDSQVVFTRSKTPFALPRAYYDRVLAKDTNPPITIGFRLNAKGRNEFPERDIFVRRTSRGGVRPVARLLAPASTTPEDPGTRSTARSTSVAREDCSATSSAPENSTSHISALAPGSALPRRRSDLERPNLFVDVVLAPPGHPIVLPLPNPTPHTASSFQAWLYAQPRRPPANASAQLKVKWERAMRAIWMQRLTDARAFSPPEHVEREEEEEVNRTLDAINPEEEAYENRSLELATQHTVPTPTPLTAGNLALHNEHEGLSQDQSIEELQATVGVVRTSAPDPTEPRRSTGFETRHRPPVVSKRLILELKVEDEAVDALKDGEGDRGRSRTRRANRSSRGSSRDVKGTQARFSVPGRAAASTVDLAEDDIMDNPGQEEDHLAPGRTSPKANTERMGSEKDGEKLVLRRSPRKRSAAQQAEAERADERRVTKKPRTGTEDDSVLMLRRSQRTRGPPRRSL